MISRNVHILQCGINFSLKIMEIFPVSLINDLITNVNCSARYLYGGTNMGHLNIFQGRYLYICLELCQ